ncbi:hypothetical protein [Mycolicibacterium mageritense]|uniref:hypothetical protein n=1 Tax=Mycolicibacterium mageritense TaxID=53462 RepID=UPI0023EFF286|nr:hypothetical protein [Mycolicibacterium mageritense]
MQSTPSHSQPVREPAATPPAAAATSRATPLDVPPNVALMITMRRRRHLHHSAWGSP